MASGFAVINHCTIKKMFSWTFNDLDKVKREHLVYMRLQGRELCGSFLISSPIEAIDYFTGTKYVATCRINMAMGYAALHLNDFSIIKVAVKITPFPGMLEGSCQINDGESFPLSINAYPSSNMLNATFELPHHEEKIKKLSFYIDVNAFRTKPFKVLPFQQPSKLVLSDELKYMYDNVPETEFTIKCENEEFKVTKPIMAARSPVFKTMFETEMKEKSQNFVEIKEFKPIIVEKMIEFCETDAIKDCKGLEDDLFKIAHLYQIQQLMFFAVEKMAESINSKNVAAYIQLADLYDLKEFKEWCLQYAQRNNIVVT